MPEQAKSFSGGALTACVICDWLWAIAMIGGSAFVVFGLGESGWWFVLAIFLASLWNCNSYRSPGQIAASAAADAEKESRA